MARSPRPWLGWSGRRGEVARGDQPVGGRDEPVPAPARRQPGRLVGVGRRGVRRGPAARRTGVPQRRVRRVPLVPRDGARVLRGRGDRRAAQRGVRLREGRPRGAARRRRRLHGCHGLDDRPGRLADDRRARPRRQPVLRRHLLPRPAADGAAVAAAGADRADRGVARPARRRTPGRRVDPRAPGPADRASPATP